MEEKSKLESLLGKIRQYAEARFDLAILNVQDKISDVFASVASILLMVFIGFFILLFISLGVAWYIGDRTGDPSMGFFSLAGFYILLALIVYFTRDKLIKAPIINSIIKKITIHEED
jgi:hypothetical protein